MNKKIGQIGASIVTITVLLFAICMLIHFDFGSYFVCMLLPIGYIMLAAGLCEECVKSCRAAARTGMAFAVVYAALVLPVYFAQTTAVRLDGLDEQAMKILDYSRGGLFFSYDLMGYGMMALSTFFLGLTIKPKNKPDKCLKSLMMIHGVFFFGCFIMPMTGVFRSMSGGGVSLGGVIALEFWCAYFLPIGVLSMIHFRKNNLLHGNLNRKTMVNAQELKDDSGRYK